MPLRFLSPNLHVVLVHYPLGVFVLGVALELLGFLWRKSTLRTAARWMIVLGALLSIPAATSGIAALVDVQGTTLSDAQKLKLKLHVIYMGIGSLAAVLCATVGLGASDRWRKILYLPLLLGVLGAWGAMVIGAYNAGETVYREGTSVKFSNGQAIPIDITGIVNFEKQVHPIIAGTCYECHAGDEHKGHLRLDSKEAFLKGGTKKGSRIIVVGHPNQSDLYDRIVRSRGSEGLMPKQGDDPEKEPQHLIKSQTDLIYAWIAQGADFGNWKGDTDPDAAADEPAAKAAKELTKTFATVTPPVEPDPIHPDFETALETGNVDEIMDYYVGGALQQHLILAGFAFAGACLGIGMAFRRLHSPSLVHETGPLPPPPPSEGDRRRVADDESMLRSFNPRAALADPPAVNRIASGRVWLITLAMVIGTASFGYWMVNGSASTFTLEGWNTFVEMLKPHDPAIKINRAAAHAILGGAFVLMLLNLALLAAIAPKKPIVLSLFALVLVAVMTAQVWVGILLAFQPGVNDATLMNFATKEEEVAAQKISRELKLAAKQKAAKKEPGAEPTPNPSASEAATRPSTAPAGTANPGTGAVQPGTPGPGPSAVQPGTPAPRPGPVGSPASTLPAASGDATTPAPDAVAAKSAAIAFVKALESGDMIAIHQDATGTDEEFKVLKNLSAIHAAEKRFEAAAVKKFGDAGKLPSRAIHIEGRTVKLDGENATLVDKDRPDDSHPMKLIKSGSSWLVDLGSIRPDRVEMAKSSEKIVDAIDAVTKNVGAGKYANAAAALAALSEAKKP